MFALEGSTNSSPNKSESKCGGPGMKAFDYFIRKSQRSVSRGTRCAFSKHMAVFIFEHYEFELRLDVEEYFFALCFTTPPPATIRGRKYQFQKGSLICLAPGDDILVHSGSPAAAVHYIAVRVLPEFLNNVYRRLGFSGNLEFDRMHSRYSRFLLEALDALIHEVVHQDKASSLMLNSLENQIAIQLIRDAKCMHQPAKAALGSAEDITRRAINYIEIYYPSRITIKDISDAIFVSPSYLQKIFPRFVGKTPYQYLMECRHRQAKHMLATTQLSMEEVARQCGFVNGAHFSTAFKQMEGISPLTFRKSLES